MNQMQAGNVSERHSLATHDENSHQQVGYAATLNIRELATCHDQTQADFQPVSINGFLTSQPLFSLPHKDSGNEEDRDALVDVTLTSANAPKGASQKKALKRGEQAYRAWKQRQAERSIRSTSTGSATTQPQLDRRPSEICVDLGSPEPAPSTGPAAALASATAAALPLANELFSRIGQLACPAPGQPSTSAPAPQEPWHWSMRLPLWYEIMPRCWLGGYVQRSHTRPFTFTVDVALADEEGGPQDPHMAGDASPPCSPPALLIPTADSTHVAWQAIPEGPLTANPLFAPTTTPSAGGGDGVALAVAALAATPTRTDEAEGQDGGQGEGEDAGTPPEQLLVAEAVDDPRTAGPTKQQQRAFQCVCLVVHDTTRDDRALATWFCTTASHCTVSKFSNTNYTFPTHTVCLLLTGMPTAMPPMAGG